MDYPWHELREQGDFVLVPDRSPRQVSHLARAYVRRRLGRRALVAAVQIHDGVTFVALAFMPPRSERPAAFRPSVPAPDAPTREQADELEKTRRRLAEDQRRRVQDAEPDPFVEVDEESAPVTGGGGYDV